MGSRHTEEFALDGEDFQDGESSAGHGPSGQGPAGPEGRRRRSPGWRHRPGLWAGLAVVLVVAGAAVSPQGEPLEPRPPETAWSASAEPGRAPGVWVLGDRPVVATADGLTAFDPATGEPAWTVDMADPACTATDQALTCVHGDGETASIATVTPDGEASELPFPGADVATMADGDLIVGGGHDGNPWLGRYTTGADPPTEVWRYQPEYPIDRAERWTGATVSQGIATVFTHTTTTSGGPALDLAAAVETGEGRPAVVQRLGGIAVSNVGRTSAEWHQQAPPIAGPGPEVPGHPNIVFTMSGARSRPGGEILLSYTGLPLLALGDDLIYSGTPPGRPAALTAPGQVAVRLERVDVLSGESLWQLDRNSYLTCPCAASPDTLALVAATFEPDESFTTIPQAVLGLDLDTGRHHWSLPLSTAPDGIAVGSEQVYLLTGGSLTAYGDR